MKDYTRVALAVALGLLVFVLADANFSFIGHSFNHLMKPLLIGLAIWYFATRSGGCCRMRSRAPEAPAEG